MIRYVAHRCATRRLLKRVTHRRGKVPVCGRGVFVRFTQTVQKSDFKPSAKATSDLIELTKKLAEQKEEITAKNYTQKLKYIATKVDEFPHFKPSVEEMNKIFTLSFFSNENSRSMLFSVIQKTKVQPDRDCVKKTLDFLRKNVPSQHATILQIIFSLYSGFGVLHGDPDLYTDLIHFFCEKNLDGAINLLKFLGNRGITIEERMVLPIITALKKNGECDAGDELQLISQEFFKGAK